MRSSLVRLTLGSLAIALAVSPVEAQRDDRVRETLFEQQFNVSAGDRLVVEVGDMDLRVETGGTSARVEVIASARDQAFARERFDEMQFSADASGGELRVETVRQRNNSQDWREWQRRGGASFVAVITIPSRFDLDLQTGDGDVVVASFEGAVDIRTGDGDVVLESLSGPTISLHTGDGDVIARSLEASTISLETGDGDLRIDEASGAVTARTGDGDVVVGIGRYEGLSIRTGDGDVTVRADPSIAADVEIDGEDLSLARASTLSGRVRDDHLSGTFNGGGPELSIRTGDGSVSIRAR
jgi:hypothetical protein